MNYIIEPVPAFNDNYIWLIRKPQKKEVVCIDPGDPSPVLAYLSTHSLTLTHILITHHHFDHIGGISTLQSHFPKVITYGPDEPLITDKHHIVKDRDNIDIASMGLNSQVIETPGHTKTHVCYYMPNEKLLFCGDTLFSAGCGRLFEGTAEEMTSSLDKLKALPSETRIYCAHEYTRNNLLFAKFVEPNNQAVIQALKALKPNTLSLPSTLKKELSINPFLRCEEITVLNKAREYNNQAKNKVDTFSVIRKLKDDF